MSTILVWTDLEAIGSRSDDPVLEAGVVLTNEEAPWPELASYTSVCQPYEKDWESLMVPVVREMHTVNGLIDEVRTSDRRVDDIEDDLIAFLGDYGKPGDFTFAGSGVGHYDRRVIKAQMPRLERWLRYPNFDIGDIRRGLKFAGRSDLIREGITNTVPGEKAHRGLADIRDHIAEAAAYAALFQKIPVGS